MSSAAHRLRELLRSGAILRTPCCHDALSARLIQRAGFLATFVSGFGVAAAKGLPDAGLVSFEESRAVMASIVDAGAFQTLQTSYFLNRLTHVQSIQSQRAIPQ